MDLFALVAVVLLFLLCLGLFFASVTPSVDPPEIVPPPVKVEVKPHPLLAMRPAVLRQNVAVSRLLI